MKRTVFITICLLFAGILNVSAQKGLSIGVGGNVNAIFILNQNAYGMEELDYKQSIGGAVNLGIGYNFTNWLGLKTEIGYTRMGQQYYDNKDNPVVTRNVKLNYITVPLLLRLSVGGKVLRFYMAAGPQFAFLTSATQDYLKNGTPLTRFYNPELKDSINISQNDIKDRYQSMDVMARVDFGLDIILLRHLAINFGLSSAYGLTDINASAWRLKNGKGEYKPSHNMYAGFNFGIRYCFGSFGKKD
ncbi:MAG: porin family protein [Bacteroidetes bacterium]|nr:porin family protein [Bacteroidota bacterium]